MILGAFLVMPSIFNGVFATEWEENRFSMFIHFGLYSELGGVWNGEKVTYGYSEQIQAHAGIYSDKYEEVADRFNPVNWNADDIVTLAQDAGMGSIILTAKHHDGFCMYNSAYTDFDVVDASPYGKDVLGLLADICHKREMDFGIYFSLIDWHFPEAYPISHHNMDKITDAHHQYNLNQIRELLTNYGPVSEMWFDMGSLTPEQSMEIYKLVHYLQPECKVSSRLGNDCCDFVVMSDNMIAENYLSMPWQAPASFYPETWGYRSWQELAPVKDKATEKFADLKRIVDMGGRYLLNIGPKGDGSITEHEEEVLLEIGKKVKADPYIFKYTPKEVGESENEYSISYMDYALKFDSRTAYHIFFKKNNRFLAILYPEGDVGRKLNLGMNLTKEDAKTMQVVLPADAEKVELDNKGVSFNEIMLSRPYKWFNLPVGEELAGIQWEERIVSKEGFEREMQMKERYSRYVNQKISAKKDCSYLMEITYGEAVRVALNGIEIADFKNRDSSRDTATAVLSLNLKRGENILTISYLNRFGRVLKMGVNYDIPQLLYKHNTSILKNKFIRMKVTAADRFPSADMELQNLIFE